MKIWIKLNIYPLLILLALILIGGIEWYFPVLRSHWWYWVPVACASLWIANKMITIALNYQYKLGIYNRMVNMGRNKYDRRIFYHYVGSPCMRHVVFFALRELGKPIKEYREILKETPNKNLSEAHVVLAPVRRVIKTSE